MNRMKLCAAAAGMALAAGLTTAGDIIINGGEISGTYTNLEVDSNGNIAVHGFSDGTGTTGPVASFSTFGACSGLTCTFDGSGSSGNITSYSWSLGDGTSDSGPTTTHTYSAGGGYNVTLTVSDGQNNDSTTRQVSVSDGTDGGDSTDPPPSNCDGVGVDSTWTRATQYTGFSPFPMPTGERHEYTLRNKNYFAIQFTVPQGSGKYGSIAYDGHPHATNAKQTWNISACPGDFSANSSASPQGACNKVSPSGSFYFATSDSSLGGASWLCTLQEGQTYYLNIVYAADPNGGNNLSVTCPSSRCGAYFDFKTN